MIRCNHFVNDAKQSAPVYIMTVVLFVVVLVVVGLLLVGYY